MIALSILSEAKLGSQKGAKALGTGARSQPIRRHVFSKPASVPVKEGGEHPGIVWGPRELKSNLETMRFVCIRRRKQTHPNHRLFSTENKNGAQLCVHNTHSDACQQNSPASIFLIQSGFARLLGEGRGRLNDPTGRSCKGQRTAGPPSDLVPPSRPVLDTWREPRVPHT